MGAGCCKEEAIDFDGEIELSHFHLLRSVGKGAFGKVRVVQHKRTKEIYALKYINKAKCIRMRAVENIIQERRLLEEVEFSLICNLRYAFQDDENLFMVLDLMLGGDLRFHLERAGPMREDVVRFYVAELALALNTLHSRRIIHRDLKPDNVLLDEHGHAHLTDFNIAVYYNPDKPLISIAGSMAYMAPEVLSRKGYFESVDWWSLGVVMFELLFGKRPFRGKSNDLLTSSILRDPLPFPDNARDLVSVPCLDVLSKLCERDISKRLGCTPDGLDDFKKHPWFEGIEWDKLVTKEAVPPFEPDSKRANFDATHELEELLMEDNPLKAKKRALTTPETELSVEMQMMEDKFTVYDFTKVRRSHSLNRSRILRPSNDPKMNSGTLDGIVTRTTHSYSGSNNGSSSHHHQHGHSAKVEQLPLSMVLTPPPPTPPQALARAYRPDSPSDRVGQDRFNPDEERLSLTNFSGYKSSPLGSPAQRTSPGNGGDNAEKEGYFELQQQQQQQQKHQQYQQTQAQPQWQRQQQQIQSSYQSTPFQTQNLENLLQSEAIVLPPTSLPRPLQPRDNLTGLRAGFPRANTNPNINSNINPAAPSSSSSATPTSSKQQQQLQPSGAAVFSSSDSVMPLTTSKSISTNNNSNNSNNINNNSSSNNGMNSYRIQAIDPLQDAHSVAPIARRAIRGRDAAGPSDATRE
ncbi:hypothetical protein EDD11_005917 [Mortierella claussenii]|nr:hypothetical protein EDD11_005917 [Mortierella claussenii]